MANDPEWFAPKRYGFGSGLPVAWQGWAVLALFLTITFADAYLFVLRPEIFFPILAVATFLFALVAAKTTRGGWRWRWGKDD